VNTIDIEIILEEAAASWILGKFARRLERALRVLGHTVVIREAPLFDSDITFYLHYFSKNLIRSSASSRQFALVTHVDDLSRLRAVRKLLSMGVEPVFMSSHHAAEISKTLKIERVFDWVSFGSDLASTDNRFRVGFASRRYVDGRKNEKWLIKIAHELGPRNVEMTIVGTGWTSVVQNLRNAGVTVKLYDGVEHPYPDYADMTVLLRGLNLYVYLGFDEGAMGSLDAYLLGVPLLISKQGFHSAFQLEEDSFFESFEEFREKLLSQVDLFNARLSDWTWDNTAGSLARLWSPSERGHLETFPVESMQASTKLKGQLLRASLYRSTFVFGIEFFPKAKAKITRLSSKNRTNP
jgi:hypothetical protein